VRNGRLEFVAQNTSFSNMSLDTLPYTAEVTKFCPPQLNGRATAAPLG